MSYYGQNNHTYSFQSNPNSKRKRRPWNKNRDGSIGSQGNVDTHLFKEPVAPPRRSNPVSPVQKGPRDSSYKPGPSPRSYFDLGGIDNAPRFMEPEHSGPGWNWDNYFHNCKDWQDKHKLAYYRSRCLSLEFENQMLFGQISSLIEENSIFAVERGETPTMRLLDIFGKRDSQGAHKPNKEMKKKKEGDKEKQEEALKKKEEQAKLDAPKQPMGLKREEELVQLYGDNSSTVHKLETAVQLNFNRNCDTYKPEMYMAVPLNPETTVG